MKFNNLLSMCLIFALTSIANSATAQQQRSFRELIKDFDLASQWTDPSDMNEEVILIFSRGQEVHRCSIAPLSGPPGTVPVQGGWDISCTPLVEYSGMPLGGPP